MLHRGRVVCHVPCMLHRLHYNVIWKFWMSTRNENAYQTTGDILVVHRHPEALVGFDQTEWHGKAELVLLWNQSG
jgi:hypothetical protein